MWCESGIMGTQQTAGTSDFNVLSMPCRLSRCHHRNLRRTIEKRRGKPIFSNPRIEDVFVAALKPHARFPSCWMLSATSTRVGA